MFFDIRIKLQNKSHKFLVLFSSKVKQILNKLKYEKAFFSTLKVNIVIKI